MTAAEYTAKLDQLEELDPANLLLKKLRQGTSVVNDLLLAQALAKAKTAERTEAKDAEVDETTDPVNDKRLRAMRTELRQLFSDRAKLSNRFHECQTNEERSHNSEDIQVVQRNIERVMLRIRDYKLHGIIPEGPLKYYIPKDGLELSKKLNSVRSNISIKKKKFNQLLATITPESSNAEKRKVESEQRKLEDLKMQLTNIEKAIEALH